MSPFLPLMSETECGTRMVYYLAHHPLDLGKGVLIGQNDEIVIRPRTGDIDNEIKRVMEFSDEMSKL
jgi:hypothetical protein